jgi:endonuclease/exonuclease/phosphatase family metal-dependent hydrolase
MNCKKLSISLFLMIISFLFCQKSNDSRHYTTSAVIEPDTFSVAFYNTENLFDATYSGDEYDEYKPGFSNWDKNMFQKKLMNTADVVCAIDAEIIGLCEIENASVLKSLQKELLKRGKSYKYEAAGDFPLKTNTCVALLSKFPIKNFRSMEVRLNDGSISRNILEVDVDNNRSVLKVFVNHWPSQSHPENTRITAATILENRIKELPPGTDYILIGDFNSNYDEFRKTDRHKQIKIIQTGINDHLQTAHHNSTGSISFLDKTDMVEGTEGHLDLWIELPPESRMSEMYKGINQTIDHILVPSSLFNKDGFSYVDNSFDTFSWNGKLLQGNTPFRWQFRKTGKRKEHLGEGYSDHLPVIARFCHGPFRKSIATRNYVQMPTETPSAKNELSKPAHYSSLNWTACNNAVKLESDSIHTKGQKSLHVQCDAPVSNISVARITSRDTVSFLTFGLKGSGKISFRIRLEGKDWIYYNAPEYQKAKSARYADVTYSDWHKIQLPVQKEKHDDSPIEIEIRAGKSSPFDFRLKEIKL